MRAAMRIVWSNYSSSHEKWYESNCTRSLKAVWSTYEKVMENRIFRKNQYKHDQINWFQHNQHIISISLISGASVLPRLIEEAVFII